MKAILLLVAAALAIAATIAFAGQQPTPLTPTDLYILHNPGKDGEIWSIGYGPESLIDINQRVRVHNQDEAEKGVALTIDSAPNRFRFAGLVRI